MIFSELYSAYYNAIAAILSGILSGERSERELQRLVTEHAFGESVLTILPSLKGGKWQLMHGDMTTPLRHPPTMPLTTLQRRWLKAISLDPRIRLFGVELSGLEGVEPLFTPADYCIYDRYSDGDPFEDPEYVRRFRILLRAIADGTQVKLRMTNRKGSTMFVRCRPVRLEYSEKDDKFRVITVGWRAVSTVNLARISGCEPYTGKAPLSDGEREAVYDTVTVRITDERNTLERFLLAFAHFEKRAERMEENRYLVRIRCLAEDEAELAIRILSFGPTVEVLGSEPFRAMIVERLKKQKSCGLL